MLKTISYKRIYCSIWLICSLFFWGVFYYTSASLDTSIPDIAPTCSYSSKLEQCIIANKNGSVRSLDFICPATGNIELMLGQIILDEEFQKIDQRALEWTQALADDVEWNANNPLQALDDIEMTLWIEGSFYREYRALCDWGILLKRAECSVGGVPSSTASTFIARGAGGSECLGLVEYKLNALRSVAYIHVNKSKSRFIEDSFRSYSRQQSDRFTWLANQMMKILGHGERLSSGITHYTPRPLQ